MIALKDPATRDHPGWRVFKHAILFSAGFTAVFILIGVSAGALSRVLILNRSLLLKLAGSVIVFFGLYMTGALRALGVPYLKTFDISRVKAQGYAGAFVIGVAFSFSSVICIGPVFGSILVLAATGTVLNSLLLSAFYALGLALPFLVVSAAVGALAPYLVKMNRHLGAIQKIGGGLLMVFGALVFTGWLDLIIAKIAPFAYTARGVSTVTLPVAFAGGVLSFFSPCFFPLIPAYLSYISGVSVLE